MKIYPEMKIEFWCETRYQYVLFKNDKEFYGEIKNDLFFWKNTTALITCPLCNGTHYINLEGQ